MSFPFRDVSRHRFSSFFFSFFVCFLPILSVDLFVAYFIYICIKRSTAALKEILYVTKDATCMFGISINKVFKFVTEIAKWKRVN